MIDDFIYLNKHSISKELCDEIINFYEEDKKFHYKGVTSSGLNINIKNTFDLQINDDVLDDKWNRIRDFLFKELNININRYLKQLNDNDSYKDDNYKLLKNEYIIETFQMQKYVKCEGKFIYHHDFNVKNNTHRIITYLWYLNDVEQGGETEILGNIKVKPEAGKLLLFPASWTFPHSGKIPISNDKYIITGWVYKNH